MTKPTDTQGAWLSAEEAGFLTAGPGRAAETVLARLIDQGLLRVSRDGLVSAVHQDGQGATTSVEARMLSFARTPVQFNAIVLATRNCTEVAQLYRQLLSRELMRVPHRRHDSRWFSLAVAGVAVVLGFISPVFFVAAAIALGFFVWQNGSGPITRAGREALDQVKASDRVHVVALYGFDGRFRGQDVGELFDFPRRVVRTVPRRPARARRRSIWNGGGCGSSSSCGSSGCGSSSSSCGGGSGCGGGGGGD